MALPLPDELLALVAAKLPLCDLRNLSLASKQLRRACKAGDRVFAAATALGEALRTVAGHATVDQKRLAIRTADALSDARRERKRARRVEHLPSHRRVNCFDCGELVCKACSPDRCNNCDRVYCSECAKDGVRCIVCGTIVCGLRARCSDYAGFAATPLPGSDRRVVCPACLVFRAGLAKSAIPAKVHH